MEHEVRNQGSGVRDQVSAAFAKASAFVKTSARQVGAPRSTEDRRQNSEDGKDLEDSSVGAAFSRDLALSTVSTPLTDLTI